MQEISCGLEGEKMILGLDVHGKKVMAEKLYLRNRILTPINGKLV